MLAEDPASLDGAYLDAADVPAFQKQSIVDTTNRHVNGKEARTLEVNIKSSQLKSKYEGYPNSDPMLIISEVYRRLKFPALSVSS